MSYTAPASLPSLSACDAAWLADTFARNHALFAGWSMEQTDPDPKDKPDPKPEPDPDPKADPKDPDKGGDKPLGENGEKALKAEREARKALEGELADLKKGLAAALGVKGDDDKADNGDALAQIQQQIADIKREKEVLTLANKHRITDEDDLALLAAASDEEAMKKLAERLAPAEEERDATSRRPKPDRSQGGGGGSDNGKSVSQIMAERRAARAGTAKSTT